MGRGRSQRRGKRLKETKIREANERWKGRREMGTVMGEAAQGDRWEEVEMERLKGTHGEAHKDVMVRGTLGEREEGMKERRRERS